MEILELTAWRLSNKSKSVSKFDNVNQKWQIASAGNGEYLILANKAGTYVTAPSMAILNWGQLKSHKSSNIIAAQDTNETTGNLISPTDKRARWRFVEAGNGAF